MALNVCVLGLNNRVAEGAEPERLPVKVAEKVPAVSSGEVKLMEKVAPKPLPEPLPLDEIWKVPRSMTPPGPGVLEPSVKVIVSLPARSSKRRVEPVAEQTAAADVEGSFTVGTEKQPDVV